MPPEQARGEKNLTTAADVYGLGATLYECLTGRPPFQGLTPMDTLMKVCSEDPKPPHLLNRKVDRDLETICLACLQKDPAKRYESASALAKDLRRYLGGWPIQKRRVSLPERVWMWTRRQPVMAALVAAVVVVFLVGVGAFGWQWSQTLGEVAAKERLLYFNRVQKALPTITEGQYDLAEDALWECPEPLRGWEWHYLMRLCRLEQVVLRGHPAAVQSVQYSPDGGRLVTADEEGTIKVWAATGKLLYSLQDREGTVTSTSFCGDGRWLVAAGEDQAITLRDAGTGEKLSWPAAPAPRGNMLAAALHGPRIAVVSPEREVGVWDVATGERVFFLSAETLKQKAPITRVALSPDGRYLAVAGFGKFLKVWDTQNGKPMPVPEVQANGTAAVNVWSVAFSPDGSQAGAGSSPPMIWDVQTGKRVDWLSGSGNLPSGGVTFSPDGKRFAATSYRDGLIRVWDLDTRKAIRGPRPQAVVVNSAVFSPDGQSLAWTRGQDVVIAKLYPKKTTSELELGKLGGSKFLTLAFSPADNPAGRQLAARRSDGKIVLWNVPDLEAGTPLGAGTPFKPFEVKSAPAEANLAFSHDGLLASGSDEGVAAWDTATGEKKELPWLPAGKVRCCAFSGDGRLATTTGKSPILLWNLATGQREQSIDTGPGELFALAFHPDNRRLVSCGTDATVKLWDRQTGATVGDFRGHRALVTCAAFSPNGKLLATASADLTVRLWDTASGRPVCPPLTGHWGSIAGVAFSPDGKRLASCGNDGTVKLWDTSSGREVLTLTGHQGHVAGVAFSADGHLLASCSHDGTVRIWDGRPATDPAP
jgi:WD40 repeat protein